MAGKVRNFIKLLVIMVIGVIIISVIHHPPWQEGPPETTTKILFQMISLCPSNFFD